ncbi:PRC-barrel domain-containing protein [Aurantimonas sp. NFXS3]|uniref:PRC-barrel domain-containing protein n=1 Tax=Aurantimonas sp. NFXS3 TaxID=2818434 RepID=UPI003B8E4926
MLQIPALLLMLAFMLAPVSATDIPIAAPAEGAGSNAMFVPSDLIGKPLSTDNGVRVGTVSKVVALAVGHFLIVAELNDEGGGGQRTVQISSKAASFTENGVRLETTADAFWKSLPPQKLNPRDPPGGRND